MQKTELVYMFDVDVGAASANYVGLFAVVLFRAAFGMNLRDVHMGIAGGIMPQLCKTPVLDFEDGRITSY